ncbi:hypothetical protein AJ78_08710 [Emergomyces pasteurianus Ep9510]|uniref:Uncharacterized protein n=1 Tax=Emergomyces pasteurianus Ep9510 TaxID=1447872 RepID=A0A1J9P2T8_9EURO|nr:hypothetical protein AJ78_08710 [Emergomyces pasteurianus Ep9510]
MRVYGGRGLIGRREKVPMERAMREDGRRREKRSGGLRELLRRIVVRNGGEERLSETGHWFGLGGRQSGDDSCSELSATVEGGHRVTAARTTKILRGRRSK